VEFITEEDPILAMLEWTAQQMMQMEAEARVGDEKGKQNREKKTHFSGSSVRRMDTRLGTMYLFIPKLRKGGYIPFFFTERKRSEKVESFRTRPLEPEYPFYGSRSCTRKSEWKSPCHLHRVIGVFPNQESYVRLITGYLIEYSEAWINERSYIKEEKLILALDGQGYFKEAHAV